MGAIVSDPLLKSPEFRAICSRGLIEAILRASRSGNRAEDLATAVATYSPEYDVAAVTAATQPVSPVQARLQVPGCLNDPAQVEHWGLSAVREEARRRYDAGGIDECMRLVREAAMSSKDAPVGGVDVFHVATARMDDKRWVASAQEGMRPQEKSRNVVVEPHGERGFMTTVAVSRDGALRRVTITGGSKVRVGHLARRYLAGKGEESCGALAVSGALQVEWD